jgi:phosphoserine phosphatase
MGIKVVFFDCDGTLTNVKSSWQYLHEKLGLWDENADAFQRKFRAGEIGYEEFCRRDAGLWKGLPGERIKEILREIPLHPGVKETVGALREAGVETVILSTGLTFLVDRVRAELGVTRAFANELIVEEGKLSGDIRINVQHDDKGYWVRRILEGMGVDRREAAAVGDGEGDLAMFEAVGVAIGYHPSEGIVPALDHALYNGSFTDVLEVLREYL